mgnify:CR=1 FL=1
MLCLWPRTFNVRRSLDGFTSRLAPIRDSGSCNDQRWSYRQRMLKVQTERQSLAIDLERNCLRPTAH